MKEPGVKILITMKPTPLLTEREAQKPLGIDIFIKPRNIGIRMMQYIMLNFPDNRITTYRNLLHFTFRNLNHYMLYHQT